MKVLLPENRDDGAFGNKLKSLITCIRSGLPYRVWWLRGFSDILDTSLTASNGSEEGYRLGCWRIALTMEEAMMLDTTFRDRYPEFFDCEWEEFNLRFSRIRTIDGMFNRIPSELKMRLVRDVSLIPWNHQTLALFKTIDEYTQYKIILGVSVRSWRNQWELYNPLAQERAKSFNVAIYKSHINRFQGPAELFLSFDNEEVELQFREFKRIRLEDIFDPLTWKLATEYQKIAAKCYMLSRCYMLIGDNQSTFIEAAWLLGGCNQPVVTV